MASIHQIGTSWRVQVRRRGNNLTKTFSTKTQAKEWARRIELDIDLGVPVKPKHSATIGEVILHYRELRESNRPIDDTSNEHYMLAHLEEGLGDIPADRLTPEVITRWCQERSAQGAGPYTIDMELSKLGTALKYSSLALGLPSNDVIQRVRPMLLHIGLIGPGRKRERRLMSGELERIKSHLEPLMQSVVDFAVLTAMRRGEIVSILHADLNHTKKTVIIRDRKDPRHKKGNDQEIPLLGQAWDIAVAQSGDERIFPMYEGMVSRLFLAACREAGIEDLHFHDLRHEGTSRLFEAGYTIEQVSMITGHKDWRHLRRYVQLRPEDMHHVQPRVSGPGTPSHP